MAYRLKRGEPIGREVRRLALKQLQLAIADLRAASGRPIDAAVYAARRHVKKVRALNRLVQDSLGSQYQPTKRRVNLGTAAAKKFARDEKSPAGNAPPCAASTCMSVAARPAPPHFLA